MMNLFKKERGFTLIEIMIVVAIVGLLASIAIPNLLRAKINANEGIIKKDLRTFSSANELYRAAQNPIVYAPAVAALTAALPPYLDTTWDNNNRHGFNLNYLVGNISYSLLASPVDANQAISTYCVDQSGTIVMDPNGGVGGQAAGCTGGNPIP